GCLPLGRVRALQTEQVVAKAELGLGERGGEGERLRIERTGGREEVAAQRRTRGPGVLEREQLAVELAARIRIDGQLACTRDQGANERGVALRRRRTSQAIERVGSQR